MATGTVRHSSNIWGEFGRMKRLWMRDHGAIRAIVRRCIINRVLARDRMIANWSHLRWTLRPWMWVTPVGSRIKSSSRCRKPDLCILRIHDWLGRAWWNKS